jgi:hypothetical protein
VDRLSTTKDHRLTGRGLAVHSLHRRVLSSKDLGLEVPF